MGPVGVAVAVVDGGWDVVELFVVEGGGDVVGMTFEVVLSDCKKVGDVFGSITVRSLNEAATASAKTTNTETKTRTNRPARFPELIISNSGWRLCHLREIPAGATSFAWEAQSFNGG